MRFSRNQRLITKAEYKSIFDKSHKVNQKYLLALFKPNQKSQARLGLVVSKRVANTAVSRNRIKRVIRESFRLKQDQLIGVDVIIIARNQCDTVDKATLREDVNRLWEKLQLHYQKLSSVR